MLQVSGITDGFLELEVAYMFRMLLQMKCNLALSNHGVLELMQEAEKFINIENIRLNRYQKVV